MRSRLELLCMAPGASRLVGSVAAMRCPGDGFAVIDVAQQAIAVHRHVGPGMGLVGRCQVHIGLDGFPHCRGMAALAGLCRNEVRCRFNGCKSSLVAIGAP